MNGNMKAEGGQTIIEFALIAILFFMMLFGVIEFALLMFNQQVIANAGREGARFGVVARPIGSFKIDKQEIEDEVIAFAEAQIISFGDKNFDVDVDFNSDPTQDSCNKFQDLLTVSVNYDYSFLFLPFAKKTFETKAIMRCE